MKKSTTIAKDKFPVLLRQLCRSTCGDDEDKLFSANVIFGLRKCGIVPLNRDEVLRRLPKSDGDEAEAETGGGSKASANVSSAVTDHLKKCDIKHQNITHHAINVQRWHPVKAYLLKRLPKAALPIPAQKTSL